MDIHEVVCSNGKYTKPPVVCRGTDATDRFLQDSFKAEIRINDILNDIEPLMSEEAEEKN